MEWEEIKKEYEAGGITLKALAEKYDIKLGTLKSRKSREGWGKDATNKKKTATPKKNATPKKSATKKKKDAPKKKHGAQPKNKNAVGNRGNKNAKPPKRNTNALKHGLFAKYFPEDTLEIMEEIGMKSTADMLWDQIVIQYTAIIRAQKIMFVKDQHDETRVLKKEKPGPYGDETEYEYQHAWDKHASFLNAQSRAMGELRSAIRQFDEVAHIDDERRLKLEGMRLNAEKTKAEIEKITNGDNDEPIEFIIKRAGEG